MSSTLLDNRIQFYLRNRATIQEWAAIEDDVRSVVIGMLDGLLAPLDAGVRVRSPRAEVTRGDGNRWRRITLRKPEWPANLSIALEWVASRVDPFGDSLPKIGVFYLADNNDPADLATRATVLAAIQAADGLGKLDYTLNAETVWLTLRFVPASDDWWKKPDEWTDWIEAEVLAHWDATAPVIDRALGIATV